MISRYFVIGLALVVAVLKAREHAWPETVGLLSLAIGLTCMRVADTTQRPQLKRVAWFCFALTLVAMGSVIQRNFLH